MTIDDETIRRLADTARDQYFLSSTEKLGQLVDAAGILPTDHVVEIGAGIGSVARVLPRSASLTLIELDERLTEILRTATPHAVVIQGDALSIIQNIPCDVLLSNLPTARTHDLIAMLPRLSLRTAVVTVGHDSPLAGLSAEFTSEIVTSIGGDDFKPPQPVESFLVKLTRQDTRTPDKSLS